MFYDVSPDIFHDYRNVAIVKACHSAIAKGLPIGAVNILRELKTVGENFNGTVVSYLFELNQFEPILFDVTRKEAFSELAGRYVQKIQKAAKLRKLTEIASEVCTLATEPGASAEDLLVRIQEAKTETEAVSPEKSTLVSLEAMLKRTLWDLKEVLDDPNKQRGITTGLRVLDSATGGGLYPGEMWIISGRPGSGKSAMAWGVAISVAKTGKTVLGISLEMGLSELGRRFLSAKTSYPATQFRTGKGLEDKLDNIFNTADNMKDLPLFLEEKVQINEIGLKQDIEKIRPDVVVLDYLQLMSASGKFYNREGEIASLSRFMKLSAIEYGLTFIVLSQLNRDLKGRSSKVPQLTDLRESGCLKGDTVIFSHYHNSFKTLESLDSEIVGMVESNKKEKGSIMQTAKKCFMSGEKQLYLVELITGHKIEMTACHKVLTPGRQWEKMGDLSKGSMVGVPLNFSNKVRSTMTSDEVKILGLFLGNGCSLPRRSLQLTSHVEDEGLCIESMEIVNRLFDNVLRPCMKHQIYRENTEKESRAINVFYSAKRQVSRKYRNPFVEFLEKYGMYGKRHKEKEIPPTIFMQSTQLRQLFIKYLWATDGSVCLRNDRGNKRPAIMYSSASELMIGQLQILLQSVGILSKINKSIKNGKYVTHYLCIQSRYFMDKFLVDIGVAGKRKGKKVKEAKALINKIVSGWTKYELSEDKSIAYVPIKEITKTNIEKVYDIEIAETHNFFANGIIVHNSLEQDADVVIGLYRDETNASGEAAIYILKNRNDRTGKFPVYFDGPSMTYRDLSFGE